MTQSEIENQHKEETSLLAEAKAYAIRICKSPETASPLIIEAYIAGYKQGHRSASAAALKALKS